MHVISVCTSLIPECSSRGAQRGEAGGSLEPAASGAAAPPTFGPRPLPSASIKLFSRGGGNRRAAESGGWTNRNTRRRDVRRLGQWERGEGRERSQWGRTARARRARRAARSAGEVRAPRGRAGAQRPSASFSCFFPCLRCLLPPYPCVRSPRQLLLAHGSLCGPCRPLRREAGWERSRPPRGPSWGCQ